MKGPAMLPDTVTIEDDLTLRVGRSRVTLTPTQGLRFSEEMARKSFRRALTEEADRARFVEVSDHTLDAQMRGLS